MNAYLRFGVTYLLFLIIVGAAQLAFNSYAPFHMTHKYAWVIFGVIAGVTGILHYYLLYAASKDPKAFIRSFMATNTLKIFIYLGFLVLFVISDKTGAASFIGHFAAYYLIFTVFEITLLYRYLLPKKP